MPGDRWFISRFDLKPLKEEKGGRKNGRDLHSVELSLLCVQLLLSFGEFGLSNQQTSLLQGQVSL